jgi:ATP-dependent DNA helicase RecG
MVEAWGRGMTLIHLNAPAVAFREVGQLFIASFERPSFLAEAAQEAIDTTEKAVDTTPRKPRRNAKETPKKHQGNTKEKLLGIIKENPALSVKALAAATEMSVDSVRHHLRALKAAGRILHVGPTKAGHWEILAAKAVDPAEAGRAGV